MGAISESATFEPTVYQLETTDPVAGGAPTANTGSGSGQPGHGDGILNLAPKQLANRTKFLNENTVQSQPGITGYTVGDILYAAGAKLLAKLGIGAAGRVLTSSGSSPQWSDTLDLPGVIRGGSLRGPRYVTASTPLRAQRWLLNGSNIPDPAGAASAFLRLTIPHASAGTIRVRIMLVDANGSGSYSADVLDGVVAWGKGGSTQGGGVSVTVATLAAAGAHGAAAKAAATFSVAEVSTSATESVYDLRFDGLDAAGANTLILVGEAELLAGTWSANAPALAGQNNVTLAAG